MKKNTEILKIIGLVATASILSSCGMLVKEVDAWGLKMKFPEGYSIGASANTIDEIDDRKGLNRDKVIPLRKQITKEEY